MKTKAYIHIKNKNYPYTLEKKSTNTVRLVVKDANIDQEFLTEDLTAVLLDLPNLILAEQKYKKDQDEVIRFRVSGKDKLKIEKKAIEKGYDSVSGYMRDLALG